MILFTWFETLKTKWLKKRSLQEARETLLQGLLVSLSVVGLPAVVAGTLEAFEQNHPQTGIIYFILYLAALATALFIRHVSVLWQSFVLMSALYVLAFYTLLVYGFHGAGIHVLLTICILSTLLHGGRAGLIHILISLMIVGTSGYLLCSEIVVMAPEVLNISTSPIAWGTAVFTFLMLSLAMVVTSGLIQMFAEHSILHLEGRQQEITQSENRYRLLTDTIFDIILVHDTQGRITYINRSGADAADCRQIDLIGSPVNALLPEIMETESMFQKQAIKAETGFIQCYEAEFKTKDGASIPVEVNASIMKSNEMHDETLLVVRNIARRRDAESAVKALMEDLEDQVKEKTIALQKRIVELEHFRDATVEREMRMQELREELQRVKHDG